MSGEGCCSSATVDVRVAAEAGKKTQHYGHWKQGFRVPMFIGLLHFSSCLNTIFECGLPRLRCTHDKWSVEIS
jgi:hypothetical protein